MKPLTWQSRTHTIWSGTLLQFPTASQRWEDNSEFHAFNSILSPPLPLAWDTLHLFNCNPFVIQSKSKAISSFSIVSSLIFHFYKLIKCIGDSIHLQLIIDCLYCVLNGHLFFNVGMHVSFLHLDHEISEGQNTESNWFSSITINNE